MPYTSLLVIYEYTIRILRKLLVPHEDVTLTDLDSW